ncbi:MAG: BspA family leucine-rich repeat surface protein [bacterium]|nr:BspA family leucine-rich repeat surface protein [bacterium]
MDKGKKKNNIKLLVGAIILTLVVVLGTTYAWLRITRNSNVINKIKAGSLEMILDDSTTDGIKLINEVPKSYRQGMETKEYTFTLTNTGTTNNNYSIYLDDVLTFTNDENQEVTITDDNKLADTKIRYILLKDDEVAAASKSKLLSNTIERSIDGGKITSKQTIKYSLRIWIDSKAGDNNTQDEVMGKLFNAKLRVEASQTVNKGDYQVTFNTDGGSSIESQTLKSGEIIEKPLDPIKEGYAFRYWSLSKNGNEYDINTPVTSDITLYAVYKLSKNPVLAVSTETSLFNNSTISRSVYKVVFSDSIDGMVECSSSETNNCYTTKWDASANLDNSVNGYYNNNTGILTIAADGEKPIANPDSSKMFYKFGAYAGIDAAKLDTSRVTNMEYMFSSSGIRGSITGLENWNTSKVTNMQGMFMGQYSGNDAVNPVNEISDISKWDVSNVTNMNYLFEYTRTLTKDIDLSKWNVKNVEKISSMFYYSNANVNMSNLKFDKIDGLNYMFYGSSGNINLSHTEFKNVTNLNRNAFDNASGTVDLSYASFPKVTEASYLVSNSNITSLDVTNLDLSNAVTYFYFIYKSTALKEINGLATLDTSKVTTFENVFSYLPSLETLDLSGWDTSKATTISDLAYGSSSVPMASLKTVKLTNMTFNNNFKLSYYLISDAPALEYLDISSLDNLSYDTRPSLLIGASPCDTIVKGKPLTIKIKNETIANKLLNGVDGYSTSGLCGFDSSYTKGVLPGVKFEY